MFLADGSIYLTVADAPAGTALADDGHYVLLSRHGAQGIQGQTGAQGNPGESATVCIGAVTTGQPDDPVSVVNVGTDRDVVLNITIPRGQQGPAGSGTGDMLSSIYDTTGSGVVDNAERLEGHPASDFALAGHDHDTAYAMLGHDHAEYTSTGHNHDGQYAALSHAHDGVYLKTHPATTTQNDTSAAVAPGYGGSFLAVESVARDGNGHVTRVDVKTVTLPDAPDAHPSGDGNLHLPATGTGNNGRLLMAGATAGSAAWQLASAHGNHVPTTETANNKRFLRNDGTWQDVTAANIGAAPGADGKVDPRYASAKTVKVTAGRAFVLTDIGRFIQCDSATAMTITIPAYATVALDADDEIELMQYGAGAVTIAPAAGVTLLSYKDGEANGQSGSRKIAGRYGVVTLKAIARNEWLLSGNLADD